MNFLSMMNHASTSKSINWDWVLIKWEWNLTLTSRSANAPFSEWHMFSSWRLVSSLITSPAPRFLLQTTGSRAPITLALKKTPPAPTVTYYWSNKESTASLLESSVWCLLLWDWEKLFSLIRLWNMAFSFSTEKAVT